MENEDHGIVRDVLADACQMSYEPQSGIAVYLDYLTPTFHISANLLIAVIKWGQTIFIPIFLNCEFSGFLHEIGRILNKITAIDFLL